MSEKSSGKITEVVAALIFESDRLLACRRPAHKARALLWEFVGGKVEPMETKEQALVRECREELGISVAVGEVFMKVTHAYPDLTVRLTVFFAKILSGTPQALEHAEIRWMLPQETRQYDFCPADEGILVKIRRDFPPDAKNGTEQGGANGGL